jgi:adenylate cyclase class 2
MAIELEAKLKVEAHDAVRQKLRELGAHFEGSRLEINSFFDTQDSSLQAADRGLRVRSRVRRDMTGESDAILTFKGPQQPGQFKNREEIETKIDDAASMIALLGALGFHPTVSFEKRRESWELEGCHIELDEVPHLGCFVEIEAHSETEIQDMQRKLGLHGLPPVKSSYIGMLMKWLREHGGSEGASRVPIRFPIPSPPE